MANRDFNKIKRTIQDFSLNTSSGGGATKVNKLPEKGEIGNLYTLPNGDMYSWYHEETTKEIPVYEAMEVGKSYKFNSSVDADDLINCLNFLGLNQEKYIYFDGSEVGPSTFFLKLSKRGSIVVTPKISYGQDGEDFVGVEYDYSGQIDNQVPATLRLISEIPSMLVTEYFVNDLSTKTGKSLQDLAFLFELEIDHYETVTTVEEGYTKINGALIVEPREYNDPIYLDTPGYDAKLIYSCAKKGCPIVIRTSAEDQDVFVNELVTFYEFGKETLETVVDVLDLSTTSGTGVEILLTNEYIQSMIGSKIKDLITSHTGSGGAWFDTSILFNAVSDVEDTSKTFKNNGTLTCLDDLIEFKFEYNVDPAGEATSYWGITLTLRLGEEPVVFNDLFEVEKENLTLQDVINIPTLSDGVDLTVVELSDLSNIIDNKDYSANVKIEWTDETKEYASRESDIVFLFDAKLEEPFLGGE